jgi:hypothetical protein
MTEGMQAAVAQGIEVDGNMVTLGLNGIPVGTEATLIFRLANDDSDTATTVTVSDVSWIDSDRAVPTSVQSLAARSPFTASETSVFLSTDSVPEQFRTRQPITVHSAQSNIDRGSGTNPRSRGGDQPFSDGVEVLWIKDEFDTVADSKQVMTTPIVIDLTKDGKPEIVFSTYIDVFAGWNTNSLLRAISGVDGTELWTVDDPRYRLNGGAQIAAADINGNGSIEIIAIHESRRVIAFNADGSFLWMTEQPVLPAVFGQQWGGPSIADLNGDGFAEIIVGAAVIDHMGNVKWNNNFSGMGTGNNFMGSLSVVADLDLDGIPEIVAGRTAYRSDGTVFWNAPISDSFNAIGNFNDDPFPEVVAVSRGRVYLLSHLGQIIWGPIAIPGGGEGGAPTIADMTNDGFPEIGVAASTTYTVFDRFGNILWSAPIQDSSSRTTGSSVFDFNGNGKAEVVYGDELKLRIFEGDTGSVLYEVDKSSCTTFEYPVVADANGDGRANIVAVANASCGFGPENGIYLIGSEDWVATRPVWNQHAYHITNINDDGTIPRQPANSWQVYNNYRRNLQVTGTQFGSPQLTVGSPLNRAAAGQTLLLSGTAVGVTGIPRGQPGKQRNLGKQKSANLP